MTNLEYLEKMKKFNKETLNVNAQCRIAKALEIIAEEKIKTNDTLCNLVTTLENIETTLKARY